ncbi:MAG: glycosyltransferase family 2 protein [Candidatus Thorarchaeota archaeon]
MKTLSTKKKLKTLSNKMETRNDTKEDMYQDLYEYIEKFKTKQDRILLSIVLPMYNEEKTIKKVLENLPYNNSIEIIVVNDHSTDNSLKEIEKINSNRKIRVINHKKNRGYGGAIVSGTSIAKGDIIVTMDSDGQHSSDDIFNLVKPIFDGEVDYTIGSRYKGTYFYKLPILTRLGEVLVEKLIQILFGMRVMNNQTGFRAFSKKILPIFHNIRYYGYAFCTEQICRISLAGFKIKECPIKVYRREYGSSSIILTKLAKSIFSCLFYYYIRKIKLLFKNTKKNSAF